MNRIVKSLVVTAMVTLPFSAALAQEANVQKLADDVYAINLMGYTSLVVIGDEDVLITETANPFRADVLTGEIAKLTDKPVGKIVLSHEHFDHTGGTEIFKGAEIIAQENVRAVANLDPLGMFPDKIDQTFDANMDIDMGTTLVRLHHFGAADGVANTIVQLPEEKIVAIADMYRDGGLTPGVFLTDTNLLGNRKALNAVASWDIEHALNAHSTSTDPASLVATAGFLNDLYDEVQPQIIEMLKDPGHLVPGIMELSETLVLPEYKDWKNYGDLPLYVQKMSFAIMHGG
ncbi:MBL fold metallo-hydrolase [uncultured Ruegeria sp.]|uniref:MBL fold metallo-hydrolase n=1 Tax=uncultured Ruegeria sp. TaxID=259304 RepID=UPI002638E60C|nr:MBL fold metallo-hydrolase [uncultured Ruegeria sp.]